MKPIKEFLDNGGVIISRDHYVQTPVGEPSQALALIGLWNTETGEFDGLFKKPEPVRPVETFLFDVIHTRAKLVNQNYLWPWRGTLSDLVTLAALGNYDRLGLLTILHSPDIPKEHFDWFRSRSIRTQCCEPMHVLSYSSFPVLSTYCGDIIFELEKDCYPTPKGWLDGNDWEVFAGDFGPLTRDFAALGFNTIRQAAWWARFEHTWRFNSRRLLAELSLGCNGLPLHAWNQCPDFYDSPEIKAWVNSYIVNHGSQAQLVQQFINYKNNTGMEQLTPCPYRVPYIYGSIVIGRPE